jgi:hypothetical protein
MDALDLLEEQHREIGALLEQLGENPSRAAGAELLARVAPLIDGHTRAERRFVYQRCAVRLQRDDERRFDEACARHVHARAAAAALTRAFRRGEPVTARLAKLREVFLAHEHDDEAWIFQRAKACLTDEQLDALGNQITRAQTELTLLATLRATALGRKTRSDAEPSSGRDERGVARRRARAPARFKRAPARRRPRRTAQSTR